MAEHKTYYDKIDPTGFRANLMAQIESRGQTVADLTARKLPILPGYCVGTPEELASMLLGCMRCLSPNERKNLVWLR